MKKTAYSDLHNSGVWVIKLRTMRFAEHAACTGGMQGHTEY